MAAHTEMMSPRAPTRHERRAATTPNIPNLISGLCLGGSSPHSKQFRGRPRRKNRSRVTWDEQVIAEHNKERGTRPKRDPDTDSTRSPQASDSEGCFASSDEERRFRPLQQRMFADQTDPRRDVDARSLARRLDRLVRSGGTHSRGSAGSSSAASSDGGEYAGDIESSPCSSRSSSSVPTSRRSTDHSCDVVIKCSDQKRHSGERHISLPEELVQSKPMSASFQARRILHYNDEVSAMKLRRKGAIFAGDSTPESNNSTDDDLLTTTNTHTNLNSTMTKDYSSSTTSSSASVLTHAASVHNSLSIPSRPSSQDGESSCSNDRGSRDRAVSFSGESGGESTSEEFRSLRRRHYAREWTKERPLATTSSVETNTHTNLNAMQGAASSSVTQSERSHTKNPMEEGRPPVHFCAGSTESSASSTAFLAKRAEHYNEMEAVRRFRSESTGDEDDGMSSQEEIADADSESDTQVRGPTQALESDTNYIFVTPSGLTGTTLTAIGDAAVANPMEPREPRLAFRFELSASTALFITNTTNNVANIDAAGDVGGALVGEPRRSPAFIAKRDAHYSQMAGALHSMPSPSENDDDGE